MLVIMENPGKDFPYIRWMAGNFEKRPLPTTILQFTMVLATRFDFCVYKTQIPIPLMYSTKLPWGTSAKVEITTTSRMNTTGDAIHWQRNKVTKALFFESSAADVIQSDAPDASDSVLVALLTSAIANASLYRFTLEPTAFM
ncbi:hypothetical protein [uncultured Pleomorphomonas sp.]|uniref:hypothetical protein n=1 Tax=uncultured Pleomorphomonas sp. TaxID=442121 RepID=UPI00258F2FB4|nr:hypothetical protein [uncultured Pleomorphomonas sp.]